MQLKGSIAVFAVAAALAGSVAAQSTIDQCRADVGFDTYFDSVKPGSTTEPTGVWKVVSEQQANYAFTGNRWVNYCDVPKNRTLVRIDERMTVDQCSVYNALGSADQKLNASKPGDAFVVLYKLEDKLNTLVSQGKVSASGRDAIKASIDVAQACIKGLM